MEEEARTHMRMNIQSLHTFGFVLTFALFAGILVAITACGALFGPPVLVEVVASDVDMSRDWSGVLTSLTKLNQQLLLSVEIHNLHKETGLSANVTFLVGLEVKTTLDGLWRIQNKNIPRTHTVTCDAGNEFCDSIVLAHEPFLEYRLYRYNISLLDSNRTSLFLGKCTFTFTYVNEQFTLLELWFRFGFLVVSVLVLLLFSYQLRSFSWSDLSVEQKWTTLLLIGLFAWNNPFFPLGLLLDHWIPAFVDALMIVSFLDLLLLYWLVMFDGIHRLPSERTWLFYVPKILLLAALWAVTIAVFTMMDLRELDDPSSTLESLPYYFAFKVIEITLLVLYVFYLAYVVCRAFGTIISASSSPFLGPRVKFFSFFTIIIFALTIAGLLAGFISPVVKKNTAEFLSFLSLYNLYIFTLAFVYLPNIKMINGGLLYDDSMVELEETGQGQKTEEQIDSNSDEFEINQLESSS